MEFSFIVLVATGDMIARCVLFFLLSKLEGKGEREEEEDDSDFAWRSCLSQSFSPLSKKCTDRLHAYG